MRRFIIKSLLFLTIQSLLFLIILIQADGHTDAFYVRFTTPKQESLILGTSRAAQGLAPKVFKEKYNINIYNYAFTLLNSPYGSVYLESIKKKVRKGKKPGIFIVTVDPWSISSRTVLPNDTINFRERNGILQATKVVNMKPNLVYLLKSLSGRYQDILTAKYRSSSFLHEDGWLEITQPIDSTSLTNDRIIEKIDRYRIQNLPRYKFSSTRFIFLRKTIEYLNKYGDVYLVRLPMHPMMLELEKELMPDFNKKIDGLIPSVKGYLDMTPSNSEYRYTDGNHLHRSSALVVTETVADWIAQLK